MLCRIADFNIEFENCTPSFMEYLKTYSVNGGDTDFTVSVTADDIALEHSKALVPYTDFQAEYAAFYTKVMSILPTKNAIVMHGSLIEVNDTGILFTAHSGTGKTTHSLLWQKLLGEKMQIINGDKPIVRFDENEILYGYGAPWCGKERFGKNAKAPLKHICFIERNKNNSCQKITQKEILNKIFDQIFIPNDPIAAANTLQILNRLLNCCEIWLIKCNMDISAAEVAYNSIFKENLNEA